MSREKQWTTSNNCPNNKGKAKRKLIQKLKKHRINKQQQQKSKEKSGKQRQNTVSTL